LSSLLRDEEYSEPDLCGSISLQTRHRFGLNFLSSYQVLQIDFDKMVNITERIKECGDGLPYASISILTLP
jgi:hypothetical protein